MSFSFRKIRSRLWVICGGFLFGIVLYLSWIMFSGVVQGGKDTQFVLKIRPGTSFNRIMTLLVEDKLVDSDWKPRVTAWLLGWRDELKAGRYKIPAGLSSYGLLKILADGSVAVERITLPEGLQSREIALILAKRIEVDSTRFVQLVHDTTLCKDLGIPAASLEGFLFPNTYDFYWGMDARQVLRIMVSEFNRQFSDSLRSAAESSGRTVLEVVTLASIIEGEAVIDSERPVISAVYHNRLRRGMLLQADPTVQYIIPDGPRRLLKRDLEIDSPYNTYKYSGLPPGPINNPGLNSILASMNPAPVNYLYFVANGDGSHTFSQTLQQHLKAKASFDKHRRKIRQAQRGRGG